MKKISVIIPCYNATEYIDRCVQSLLSQTIGLDQLELIFVNDASTDNTLDILMNYEKQYEDSIMVINCEQNGKQGTARNIGMQYASCDYIGFVDADDWIEPSMYEKLYQKAMELDCDMVGCLRDRISSASEIKTNANSGNDRYFTIQTDEERTHFLDIGIGPNIWCKIYRKSIIFDNEIFFPEGLIYEDNYWGCMINYYVNSAYMIDEVLYHWYVNPNSTSMKRNDIKHLDRLTIEELKMESYKERGLYNRFQARIEKEFMQLYYFNTLLVIFTRFDEFPLFAFRRMQYNIMKYIPHYATLYDYPKRHAILIDLINIAVTQEDLNKIQQVYLEHYLAK